MFCVQLIVKGSRARQRVKCSGFFTLSADIFFGPEKTGPKINPEINPVKQIDVIDYNNMLSTNLKIYLPFEFVDFVLLQAFL